ncbi:hypothetical protein DYB28_009218 [Aphanomyces astaci]|uniref:SnoaL-like domain-containing protein n=1 Tax=Aphanomyces astaci TaxID=112090 RepID=A0A9X8DUN2_APHAT|nr:hypothetical protein DYB28_009218 [Aphanomyces astaci]
MTPLDVIAKVMALYDTETPDVDAIIETFYHPNAVFSDPLVKVHGRDNIAAQFRVLPCLFSSASASMIRASVAGVSILTIDRCSFRMFTILEVKDLKIVSHTDHWDLKSVLESVPLFSTLYPKVRYLLGYSSTKVINVLSPRAVPPLPVELEAHQLEESKVDTV